MNQIQRPIKRNIDMNSSHLDVLGKIFKNVNQIIKGKRDVMYSDIINIIARKNYRAAQEDWYPGVDCRSAATDIKY